MNTGYKQYKNPKKARLTHCAKWTSIMRKLDDQLSKEAAERKKNSRNEKGNK